MIRFWEKKFFVLESCQKSSIDPVDKGVHYDHAKNTSDSCYIVVVIGFSVK